MRWRMSSDDPPLLSFPHSSQRGSQHAARAGTCLGEGRSWVLARAGSSSPAPGSCTGLHICEDSSYFAFTAAAFLFKEHDCNAGTPPKNGPCINKIQRGNSTLDTWQSGKPQVCKVIQVSIAQATKPTRLETTAIITPRFRGFAPSCTAERNGGARSSWSLTLLCRGPPGSITLSRSPSLLNFWPRHSWSKRRGFPQACLHFKQSRDTTVTLDIKTEGQ